MFLGHDSLQTYCFTCKITSSQTLSEDSSPLCLTWSSHVFFFTPFRVPSLSCSWRVISEQVWLSLKLVISKKCQKPQVIITYIISTVQYILLSHPLKQTNAHSECFHCMSNKEKPISIPLFCSCLTHIHQKGLFWVYYPQNFYIPPESSSMSHFWEFSWPELSIIIMLLIWLFWFSSLYHPLGKKPKNCLTG